MVDRFEKFSAAISEIHRHWHRIAADEMEKYGLKGPYAVYFTTLFRHTDGITSVKLAELCGKDKADVSRALNILEKKELVKKVGVKNLYRASVMLTEKGRELAKQINDKAKSAVEYVGKDLGDKNREIFYACLEKITANLQILSKEGL